MNNFNKNLIQFFNKKVSSIRAPYLIEGSKIQKKVWYELKKIKLGTTKTYGEITKKYRLSPTCGKDLWTKQAFTLYTLPQGYKI